ncbi:Decaprenyl diphosphate synthase-like protein [Gymnopilus junonius]|uniref:Alkyl transferase n=1 Tax=Gymnopilus junonius TaxID=109634 RepID=A0A9P5N7X7_GYMJU|nr:Decaprenyl diphosphate synthase-like protein [Gymnopilus junonius]
MFIRRGLTITLMFLWNKITSCAYTIFLQVLASGPIPKHIAFILDGNRRYARKNNMPVPQGHSEGSESLHRMLEICLRLNVKCISAYVFSLAEKKLIEITQGEFLEKHGVRLNVVGNKELLPAAVQKAAREAEGRTRHNTRFILNLHMPYTSRDEITSAVASCVRNSMQDESKIPIITEKDIDAQLMTSLGGSPPLDILIRPSGVKRLSDYMLWQCCEDTQIQFCPTYWPEFGLFDFVPIILDYQRRNQNK